MKFYFILQYRRLERRIQELGVHPVVGYILIAILFPLASGYLFTKTEFAAWLYAFLALMILSTLGEVKRNDQLFSIFTKRSYHQIRILENVVVALPFITYLVFRGYHFIATGLGVVSILLAVLHFRIRLAPVLPTPFRKFPFEFTAGFRRTFWLIGLAYFLLAKSLQVDNFNLGLFALALLFFNGMSFYTQPEDEYFVWIYNCNSKAFLHKKLLTAIICISMLTIPLLAGLLLAYPDRWWLILGIQVLGSVFLCTMILAKYSAYPREINLPQAFLFGLSLWFPPMLLVVIPLFYNRSRKQLKAFLE